MIELSDLPELPSPYTWGEVSGDYRAILMGGKEVGRFGGAALKVLQPGWRSEIAYQLTKIERNRKLGRL